MATFSKGKEGDTYPKKKRFFLRNWISFTILLFFYFMLLPSKIVMTVMSTIDDAIG